MNQNQKPDYVDTCVPKVKISEITSPKIKIWETTSRPDGTFEWHAVVPGVPQRCAARAGDDGGGEGGVCLLQLAEGVCEDVDESSGGAALHAAG